jgi:hypothetical protein
MGGELRVRAETVPQSILFTGSGRAFCRSAAANDVFIRTSDATSPAWLGAREKAIRCIKVFAPSSSRNVGLQSLKKIRLTRT